MDEDLFLPTLIKGESPMDPVNSPNSEHVYSPMVNQLSDMSFANGDLNMIPSTDQKMVNQQPPNPNTNTNTMYRDLLLSSPAPSNHSQAEVNEADISAVLGDAWNEILDATLMYDSEVQPTPDNVTCDYESPYRDQWNKIDELMRDGSEVIKRHIDRMWVYSQDTGFDFTIRKRMNQILELMRWDKVNRDEHEISSKLITHLYGQVQDRLKLLDSSQENNYRISLLKFSDKLVNPYYQSAIASHIKEVLDAEKAVIDQSEMQQNAPLIRIQDLSTSLEQIKRCSYETEHSVQTMLSEVQELMLICQGQIHCIDSISVDHLNATQRACLKNAINRRNAVTESVSRVVQEMWQNQDRLQEVMKQVLDEEVKNYHRNQAFINNGQLPTHSCSINQLQEWCKIMASLISSGIQNLEKMRQYVAGPLGLEMLRQPNIQPTQSQYMDQLKMRYQNMIEELVKRGLVVDKHPPQVLMKDKRFQCTLRHLVGDALDIHQLNFRVTAHLLNADQALNVLTNGPGVDISESGKIVNHQASSDYLNHGGGIISINMRNMCLKMQQRGGQRSQEMVAEHKFAMLFRANIDVHHNPSQPTTVVAETMSLPIVVISHGKQEADAQATIFWDNAFSKLNRKPFEVDSNVPWTDLLDALDKRWKKACDEGQSGKVVGLTDQARRFLTRKMYNQSDIPAGTLISWQRFNHEKGSNPITFWTWFFKVMELCSSSHVRKYWNKGYIHGFVSKSECHDMLMRTAKTGVFLFRFSETQLGCVSISCNKMVEGGKRVVNNLQPDSLKDFDKVTLPDMVKQLDNLQYLYPDIPKDEAFANFYKPLTPVSPDGYIPKELMVQLRNTSIHEDSGPTNSWQVQQDTSMDADSP